METIKTIIITATKQVSDDKLVDLTELIITSLEQNLILDNIKITIK